MARARVKAPATWPRSGDDIAGTAVTSLDDNGDECRAQGEETIIFSFSAMTPAAWAWFKDPHRFLPQMK